MSWNDWISRCAARSQYLLTGRPEHIIFFGYGLGDDLLCATVARELKKRGAGKIVMFSQYPSLFEHNPDVTAVYNFGYPAIGRLRRWGYSCLVPQYGKYDSLTDKDITPPGHFLEIMCRMLSMKGTIDVRTYFYLTAREKEKGRLYPCQAVIHSTGLATMANKRWPTERYQKVVDETRGMVQWIQLGLADDPPIRGAFDLRGKSTLRESAALLAGAKVFLGQAGFLMHLARAVDTRSVIVYGGREDPAVSGYRANENIVGRTVCSPCWQRTRCDYEHECMRIIEPDAVIAAVKQQIERAGTPLEVEAVDLESGLQAAQN
ncbi:MAG TPA: glycosyltransferase family 9 protein [Candidatus Methylacidiphilales bacterium]|nr:glycosyltransferase family 9 protein [Candidatus Methylacidiphilales bacterium]